MAAWRSRPAPPTSWLRVRRSAARHRAAAATVFRAFASGTLIHVSISSRVHKIAGLRVNRAHLLVRIDAEEAEDVVGRLALSDFAAAKARTSTFPIIFGNTTGTTGRPRARVTD